MNNKLELKHLAPYLPYSLIFKTDFDHLQYLMTSLNIHKSKVTFRAINNFKNSKTKAVKLLGNNKPILRPLSDLTTSHNIFEDKAICFIDESDNGGSFTIDDIYFKYKESSFSDWRNAYLLLLKNHFDVFGLIEKGLAIDINTIKS